MPGAVAVAIAFLGVWLVLGLVALLRARQADIPAVVRALGRWPRRELRLSRWCCVRRRRAGKANDCFACPA